MENVHHAGVYLLFLCDALLDWWGGFECVYPLDELRRCLVWMCLLGKDLEDPRMSRGEVGGAGGMKAGCVNEDFFVGERECEGEVKVTACDCTPGDLLDTSTTGAEDLLFEGLTSRAVGHYEGLDLFQEYRVVCCRLLGEDEGKLGVLVLAA